MSEKEACTFQRLEAEKMQTELKRIILKEHISNHQKGSSHGKFSSHWFSDHDQIPECKYTFILVTDRV